MIFSFNLIFLSKLVGIGVLSGTLGALLGIGGGVINVPFILQLGAVPDIARTAGLLLSSVTGIASFISHRKAGNLKKGRLVQLLPWAIIGVIIGVSFQFIFKLLFPAVNYAVIFKSLFVVILVFALVRMINKMISDRKKQTSSDAKDLETMNWPFRALIAAPGGFLAGILGIGGGVYYGPILKTVAKLPIKEAIPLSSGLIAVSVPIGAVLAETIFILSGNIAYCVESLLIAAFVTIGTLFGVVLGIYYFKKISSLLLNIIYILLLVYNTVKLLIGIFS